MKNIVKRFCMLLLCAVIVSESIFSSVVYASEITNDEELKEINDWTIDKAEEILVKSGESIGALLPYLLSVMGFVSNPSDVEQAYKNNKAFRKEIDDIWNLNNIKVSGNSDTGIAESVTFSKALTDALLRSYKEYADEKTSTTKGYVLEQTVPISKMRKIFFDDATRYTTLHNFVKEYGTVIINPQAWVKEAIASTYIAPVDFDDFLFLDHYGVANFSSGKVYCYRPWSTFNKTMIFKSYYFTFPDEAVDSLDDLSYGTTGKVSEASQGYFYGYSYYTGYLSSFNDNNPFYNIGQPLIISLNQYSFPVFESQAAFLDYSIANGMYYTSSSFTGEGKEITIDLDTLNDILDGYYDGMYDMLQQLISESSFTLDPEQLQELVDAVERSYGLIADAIKEQTGLIQESTNVLQKIYGTVKKIYEAMGSSSDGSSNDFLDNVNDKVRQLGDSMGQAGNMMKQRFPFSIPWDMEYLLEYLADEPVTPCYEIPIVFERYGISEKITIDFSRFSVISKMVRCLLTVTFIIGLMKFTEKIVAKGGN